MPARELIRHDLQIRRTEVIRVVRLTETMVRVTVGGESLAGFTALGPADHVKLFLPDPETGTLTTPEVTPEGLKRPTDGLILSRDYTPLAFREAGGSGPELDIDFVLHGDEGPASAFAASAAPGDLLGVAGPRGSKLVPTGVARATLIADETALPALTRWLELLPADVPVTAIVQVQDEDAEGYLSAQVRQRASIEVLYREDGPGQLLEAVRSLDEFGPDDFVWAAGEASELIPVRRHLRAERGLGKDNLQVEGYWKRGIVNLDHHAPLDASDPD